MSKLELRDAIAIACIPAAMEDGNHQTIGKGAAELGIDVADYDVNKHWPVLLARKCYRYADAFLEARNEPAPPQPKGELGQAAGRGGLK